ncbi:MAG TPA: non-homologous end-joining DNA ligase [Steroidobacteraceae bacterium]|nr:non-homologous end-joining DNA ligase [Steroidobacteraceae bacterium]
MKKQALDRYAAKRKFTVTPEPGPKLVSRRGPLLFVIQKHAATRLHYDFRLELDGVLKSWAVPKGPSLDPADKRLAVEVEDHPFDYGSFEGVIPDKQYGAGNVIVWDCGVYSPDEGGKYSFSDRRVAEERLRQELKDGKLSFFLCGEKLKGSYTLVRTKLTKQWLLIKHRDRFAQANDVLAKAASVLSGYSLDDMATSDLPKRLDASLLAPAGPPEAVPKTLAPMLADIGDEVRTDPKWLYEPKLDGYRVLAFVEDGKVRLLSRKGIDYTAPFPEVTSELAQLPYDRIVLDGEIVAFDPQGVPSFNALQNRAKLKTDKEIAEAQATSPIAYVCFDLLHFAGLNLRGSRYFDRRRYLTQCLLPSAHIQLVHVSDNAEKLYAAAMDRGFEGIVAKRKDSIYTPGKRSNAWQKIKAVQSAEFVVGGYTKGKGAREPLGALLLGYWDKKNLRYVGHVGSGLDEKTFADLRARVAKLTRKTPPFADKPDLHRPTTWLEPNLVAEVNFASFTPDGNLRAPVFLRLRDDIKPGDVRSGPEQIGKGNSAGRSNGGTRGAESEDGAEETPTSKSGRSSRARSSKRGAKATRASSTTSTGSRATSARVESDAADRSPSQDHIDSALEQLDQKPNRLDINVGGAIVRLTNLDREYWPGDKKAKSVTKRDLLRYLAGVSPYMLPHLQDRPLTMIRMPEGINGERFFQKHWSQAKPDYVDSVTVFSEHKDERHSYVVANNLPTLLWLGQVGTLEFHVWHSRYTPGPDTPAQTADFSSSIEALESSVLNYPDYLVFDLDPYIYSGKEAQGAEPELNKKGFAMGRRVAFWLRALLKEMKLDAVVKTSGKTGLHIFVPIERTVNFDEARRICEMVGRHLMSQHPKDITMDWSIPKRTGKIFIDYNMNVRGKTLNSAYSPRGVPGAPVSMPLTWEELEAAEPTDFTIANALQRLSKTGDRWRDVSTTKYSLSRALAK